MGAKKISRALDRLQPLMIHPAAELFFTDGARGHGARARVPIRAGTVAWGLCPRDEVLTPGEVAGLEGASLARVEHFSYRDHAGNYVLCWDAGRYVNHSCRPSMRGLGPEAQILIRDVAAGEEITCDYGECNLTQPLECACGEPACRGTIRGSDVLALAARWDLEVAAALEWARSVDQPLLSELLHRELVDAILDGLRPPPSLRALYYDRGGLDPDRGAARRPA